MNRGNDRLITFPSTTFCLVVQQQLQLLLRFLQFISELLQLDHTSLLFFNHHRFAASRRVDHPFLLLYYITGVWCTFSSTEHEVRPSHLSHRPLVLVAHLCVCVCVCTCCVFSFCFIAPLSSLAAAEPHSFFTALYRRRRRRRRSCCCCCLDMVIRKGSYRRT